MTLKEGLECANAFFLREDNSNVGCALDARTHWIFYPDHGEDDEVGLAGIKIDKMTGKIEDFILPDDENFDLLENAEEINLD